MNVVDLEMILGAKIEKKLSCSGQKVNQSYQITIQNITETFTKLPKCQEFHIKLRQVNQIYQISENSHKLTKRAKIDI